MSAADLHTIIKELESEKKLAAHLAKQLEEKEAAVGAAAKAVAVLRRDVDAEAKARVALQIDMGEYEAKLKQLVNFMQKSQALNKPTAAPAPVAEAKLHPSQKDAEVPVKYSKRTGSTLAPDQIAIRVIQSLQRMQMAGNTRNYRLSPADTQLWQSIKATPVEEYPSGAGTAVMVGQWLTMFHTLRIANAKSDEEGQVFLTAQVADVPLTYHLFNLSLSSTDMSPADKKESEDFCLELAGRLRNAPLLTRLFESVFKRGPKEWSDSVYVVLMTSAVSLGRWANFREIVAEVQKKDKDNLRQFHQVALQQPGFPDLEQLYTMSESKEGKVRADSKTEEVQWREYKVSSSILKLKKVTSPDPEAASSIENDFKEYPEGKELCSPDSIHRILRCGAYAQYLATGQTSIPVSGPCDDKAMELRGWVELKAGAPGASGSSQAVTRQEESYKMTLKSSDAATRTSVWVGEYTMLNKVNDPKGPGMELYCVFDATIVLTEQDISDGVVTLKP